ncbi:hypothetical protein [Thermomonas alba]|uniref:hypothetical protein n=1 Tax=Thermomonas alba TaxID=2888525 RepID=UPI001F035A94|nr:hypothetical protein [Thermomonas alba]
MVIWGIAETPMWWNPRREMVALRRAARGGRWIPGLGLPIVTATEPACAGTPEQGLPMGVDSPVSPGVAA